MELDAEIDRLYGVPLDEFISDRDELAKRLRREGEREAADQVKKLRKPSAGAWALNQAVRRRRKETDALLAAGERLRESHEALLSGGDAAALREAMQEERALASALADCAEAIASETGKSGPALRERVRATLHAASVDEEAREELARGRFVREREAAGLGPLGAGAAVGPPASRRREKKGGKPSRSKTSSPSSSAVKQQEAAERERRERLAEAERAVEEARAELEEAEAAHSGAADALQAAREAVGEAEDAEREARAVARERRRELGKLERELQRQQARSR